MNSRNTKGFSRGRSALRLPPGIASAVLSSYLPLNLVASTRDLFLLMAGLSGVLLLCPVVLASSHLRAVGPRSHGDVSMSQAACSGPPLASWSEFLHVTFVLQAGRGRSFGSNQPRPRWGWGGGQTSARNLSRRSGGLFSVELISSPGTSRSHSGKM